MSKKLKKIVPDTSVLISGIISDKVEKSELNNVHILVPGFVLGELQTQASKGLPIGFKGLEELERLRALSKKKNIRVTKKGRLQTLEEIRLAKSGRIDALIIDFAKKEGATLYTSDMVQHMVAKVQGVDVVYFKPYEKKRSLRIEKMMTKDTLSLHLKEGIKPMRKRGRPGNFKLEVFRKKKLTVEEMEEMTREILDACRYEDGFIEFNDNSAMVVQIRDLRITIARPPFSDGVEITVVRPVAKLTLDDYKVDEKLKDRIKEGSGIIIAGPPGSGKSTLAASIAEFYESLGRIVKTMEQPRDLQVKDEITQYTKLKGNFEQTAELLLLVRPDYTIYDEMRTSRDFSIFRDLRLAGIGMVGVVHGNSPIDAVQRFLGRVELGQLPHVVDTVIFIYGGEIKKVYKLQLVVRVPTGMTESDLARPIVEVRDFYTEKLEYEIYTYGEENVLVPVQEEKEDIIHKLAKQKILEEVRKFDKKPEIFIQPDRVIVRVENDSIPFIIGKKGRNIQALEKKLEVKIEILPKIASTGKKVSLSVSDKGKYLIFEFDKKYENKVLNFYVDGEFIFSAVVGKNGVVKVRKNSEQGKRLMSGMLKNNIKVFE